MHGIARASGFRCTSGGRNCCLVVEFATRRRACRGTSHLAREAELPRAVGQQLDGHRLPLGKLGPLAESLEHAEGDLQRIARADQDAVLGSLPTPVVNDIGVAMPSAQGRADQVVTATGRTAASLAPRLRGQNHPLARTTGAFRFRAT